MHPIFKSCKNCPDRYVGCHSICEKYLKEVEENKRLKEKERDRRNLDRYIGNQIAKMGDRISKKEKKTRGYRWTGW